MALAAGAPAASAAATTASGTDSGADATANTGADAATNAGTNASASDADTKRRADGLAGDGHADASATRNRADARLNVVQPVLKTLPAAPLFAGHL